MADDLNGFGDLETYKRARARDWQYRHIRRLREHNRHLSIAQLADHVRVSTQMVKSALALRPDFPDHSAPAGALTAER